MWLRPTCFPKRWTRQSLQLSVDATVAFSTYRKGKGPKAFAISPDTGAYAFGKGEGADVTALTACNTEAKAKGATDCDVVIAD